MALLRSIEIGHPNDGPMARHHLSDHRGGTTVAHDVYHHLIVLEHPVPVGASVDTPEVSSEPTIRERRNRARMVVTSVPKHGLARCNIASSAPSLVCRA